MKRRLLTVISAILVLFVVASCGKKNGADTGNDSDKKVIKYGKAAGPYTVLFVINLKIQQLQIYIPFFPKLE